MKNVSTGYSPYTKENEKVKQPGPRQYPNACASESLESTFTRSSLVVEIRAATDRETAIFPAKNIMYIQSI